MAKYTKIGNKYYTVGEGSQLQQITEQDIIGRRGDLSANDYKRFGGTIGDPLSLVRAEGDILDIDPSKLSFGSKGEVLLDGRQLSLGGSAASVKPGTTVEQFSGLPFNPDFSNYLRDTGQTYGNGQFSGIKIPKPVSVTDSRPASELTKEEYAARAGVDVSRVQGTPGSYVIGSAPTAISPSPGGQADQTQNNQEIINQINNEANKEQNGVLDTILNSFGKVDTSKSTDLTDKLLSTIEGVFNAPAPEKPQSLSDLFATKKVELGIDKLETDLAGIDAKVKQLDADFSSNIESEEGKLVSTREISRNLSQTEIAYNRKRRDLLVEKDTIANQLNNKLNTLEMVMNFTQSDFTNASNFYNQQYNKNLGLLNLVLNLEERQETRQDKIKNEAQANLNTVHNLMDKQGMKYESLSASQKAAISKLELSAGLPQGITSLIAKSSPGLEIKATTSRTDAGNNVYYDVLLTNPKTGEMIVKSIFRGKEKVSSSDIPTPVSADLDSARSLIVQGLEKTKGTDNKFDPDKYAAARTAFKKNYPKADVSVLDKLVSSRFGSDAAKRLRSEYGIVLPN